MGKLNLNWTACGQPFSQSINNWFSEGGEQMKQWTGTNNEFSQRNREQLLWNYGEGLENPGLWQYNKLSSHPVVKMMIIAYCSPRNVKCGRWFGDNNYIIVYILNCSLSWPH